MLATVDWSAIVALAALLAAILGAVIKLVLLAGRILEKITTYGQQIDRNSRHLDSLANSYGQLYMKQVHQEEWLEETQGYRPARTFPNPFTGQGGDDERPPAP